VDFTELVTRAGKNPNGESRILAFDPGHTTGWAAFENADLIASGEIDTTSIGHCIESAMPLFIQYTPKYVVMEDYRIYKWRQKQHVGSEVLTIQIIGCLQTLAIQDFVPYVIKQPAQIAKGFCTDAKLKEWEMYQPGARHARDAIRHGCYFIMFGAIRPQDKT
jgi:hypothetical protein